jgi:5'-nucleotidase
MRFYYNTDIALMAGGTMRGDQIYPAGVLKLGDIISCFPFEDPCVVIKFYGRALLEALENSVSKLPAQEGRFCQVSGLSFGYDPLRMEGDRVRWVRVGSEVLDLEKRYSCATRGYMARGKDGFESMNVENGGVEEVISEEHGVLISMIIRQYFLSLKVLSRWKRGGSVCKLFNGLHHHQTKCGCLTEQKAEEKTQGEEGTESSEEEDDIVEKEGSSPVKEKMDLEEEKRLFELKKRVAKKWEMLAKQGRNMRRNGAGNVGVDWCRSVRPRVEGRINIVSS